MEPFLKEALPAFDTLVGGFDGIVIKDSHLPNHVNGEIDPNQPAGEVVKRRMLKLNEDSVGTYAPYLVNNTVSEEVSTYYLPFIPNFDYSLYLDNMTVSLNASQGGSDRIPNIFIHNGVAHRAL